MRPPLLQTAWHNRAAFDPGRPGPPERFVVHAVSPDHRRTLTVVLALGYPGEGPRGTVQVAAASRDGTLRVADESFAPQRLEVDPERAGCGIGECGIQEDRTGGIVHGNAFAVGWDLAFGAGPTAVLCLPAPWLYRRPGVGPKAVVARPNAAVTGRLEIWGGLSRRAGVERVDLAGWHAVQQHVWGPAAPGRTARVHAVQLQGGPAPAAFFAATGPLRLGLLGAHVATTAAVIVGDRIYAWSGWRTLVGGSAGSQPPTAQSWHLQLRGPAGALRAEVHAEPAAQVQGAGPGAPQTLCPRAELIVHLAPPGEPELTLSAPTALYQVWGAT